MWLCPVIRLHVRCFQMINEQAGFQGEVSLLGVNCHDVVVGKGVIVQYGDQFAGSEFGLYFPCRTPGQPISFQTPAVQEFSVVAVEIAGSPDNDGFVAFPEMPATLLASLKIECQAIMLA